LTIPAEKSRIPVWADGLGMGWILTPFLMWLASSEFWASFVAISWLTLRFGFGLSQERRCLGLAVLFGLLFEVALWRTGACLYRDPGVLYTPLWIFPLWAGGGLLITRFAAPDAWEQPKHFIRALALIPFAVNCVAPSSWFSSLCAATLALLAAAFLWREQGTAPQWGRSLRILLVGFGGTSASYGFGYAGICIFPQAWHGIPPWGISLWTSLTVALLAFRRDLNKT
jgi:hypothetical protein